LHGARSLYEIRFNSARHLRRPGRGPTVRISRRQGVLPIGRVQTGSRALSTRARRRPSQRRVELLAGRSYETLADIATPFGRKYRSLARTHLTRALELAPGRSEYRGELFEFLLDCGRQNQARDILLQSAESDPDYEYMLSRFQQTRRLNASLNGWLARFSQLGTAWH
jgi:hypothetical protein